MRLSRSLLSRTTCSFTRRNGRFNRMFATQTGLPKYGQYHIPTSDDCVALQIGINLKKTNPPSIFKFNRYILAIDAYHFDVYSSAL